jgi:hypothetical protein
MVAASLLGVDADTWSVVIAALALAISVYSVISARKAEARADRVADATVASARASERSAGAAEQSAEHAHRSADASERLADANERLANSDEARALREEQARRYHDAPAWAPTSEDAAGYWNSDNNRFWGSVQNVGKTAALVTSVTLDLPDGGRVHGLVGHAPGGTLSSSLDVQPGRPLYLEFSTTDGSIGTGLKGAVRPVVKIPTKSVELDWAEDLAIEFFRKAPTQMPDGAMWQARAK